MKIALKGARTFLSAPSPAARDPVADKNVRAPVASFIPWQDGVGDVKSSARSAMFIATRVAPSAKLRRSGICSRSLGHCRRFVGATIPIHAAPTELGRTSGVVVAINMALLTELDPAPPWKVRIRCGDLVRAPHVPEADRNVRAPTPR